MSITAMAWVRKLRLETGTKFLLMALADFADDKGYSWPSVQTLCDYTCQSRATVFRQVAALEAMGLLSRRRRFRHTNIWALHLPVDGQAPAEDPQPEVEWSHPETFGKPESSHQRDIELQDLGGLVLQALSEPSEQAPLPEAAFAAPAEAGVRDVEDPGREPDLGADQALKTERRLRRAALKDALVAASRWSKQDMGPSAWGRVERAAKEADEGGWTPRDISRIAEMARERWPGVDVTPQAILNWMPMARGWVEDGPVARRGRR